MPTEWINLLMLVYETLDRVDADLTDAQRNLFYAHLLGTATRRQHQRALNLLEHPLPNGDPLYTRDPSGA